MGLLKLLNNVKDFNYYTGKGNFIQKTLQYSKDQPQAGYSGQPFIKWAFPENASQNINNYYKSNRSSLDYPMRGGSTTVVEIGIVAPKSAEIDRKRITAFMKSNPKGPIFIQKQIGLQLSNPKIEVGSQINLSNTGNTGFLGEIEYTRIYNEGRNTLAQVGYQGSGTHADRHGIVAFNSSKINYFNTVSQKESKDNRLIVLLNTKIRQAQSSIDNINAITRLGISTFRDQLFNYLGGPGSKYGLGVTTIKRYVDTGVLTDSEKQASRKGTKIGTVNESNFSYTFNYNKLAQQIPYSEKPTAFLTDFRTQVGGKQQPDGRYKTLSIEQSKGWGRPGKIKSSYINYTDVDFDSIDKLNNLDVFRFDSDNNSPWNTATEKDDAKDLIKFGFEAVDNDEPTKSLAILFRAFLDSFNDSHAAQYTSFRYVGRGDELYVYQGFARDITFSFKIAAQTRSEMIPLYRKLTSLASQIYPDYSETGIMRAPLVKLTVGDYVYRQPGFLQNVTIAFQNDYPWEIALDKTGDDSDMYELPQILNVNCTFKVIHNFLPQRAGFKDGNVFIPSLLTPDPSTIASVTERADLGGGVIADNTTQKNLFGIGKTISTQKIDVDSNTL
jgi:hypothetical protein